jgi:hypothetical protein
MKAGWLVAMSLLGANAAAHSQAKGLGSVAVADATVTGAPNEAFQLVSGKAQLNATATVTAKPGHNADVALNRGGAVMVCQTTALHLTATNDNSLLLALDRGAMEIRMKASASDVVMTPDLRFTLASAGPLDLQMRVTFNGDTCVENRGRKAPVLNITDSFGETAYMLKPGQHVMFEHGNLRTVMDRETTPCGCPAPEKPGLSLADAILRGGQNTPLTPQQAAAIHPFPAAESDGLAAPPPAEPETPGERHVQVATTLVFDPSGSSDSATAEAPPAPVAPPPAPAVEKRKVNPFVAIGRFFRHLFVR